MTWPHPARGTCVPGCPDFGRCHCGCGKATNLANEANRPTRSIVRRRPYVFLHGHNLPAIQRPNARYDYSKPMQRVLPLVEFLFDQYRTPQGVADATGLGRTTLRDWRAGRVRRAAPTTCQRVVAAVKAREAELRAEARQDAMRIEAHDQHVRRGRLNEDCDACFRVVSEALPDRERVEA